MYFLSSNDVVHDVLAMIPLVDKAEISTGQVKCHLRVLVHQSLLIGGGLALSGAVANGSRGSSRDGHLDLKERERRGLVIHLTC